MSLPLSTSDFLDLSKYCLQLIERLQNLKSDHEQLAGEAGILIILFNDLHFTLLQFQNIPADRREILTGMRKNCYDTLHKLESHLRRYEKSHTDNVFKRHARRLIIVVKNRTPELKTELYNQTVLMSHMLSLLRQQIACFKADRFQSNMLQKIEELTHELRLSRLEHRRDQLFLQNGMEKTLESIQKQVQLAGPSFEQLIHPGSLINLPFISDDLPSNSPAPKPLTPAPETPPPSNAPTTGYRIPAVWFLVSVIIFPAAAVLYLS